MTATMIYLITLCGDMKILAIILGVGSALLLIPIGDMASECHSEEREVWKKRLKRVGVLTITLLILGVALPSTKTLIAMYVIPPIVNSESVQQLPAEFIDFLHEYLKGDKE